MNVMRIAIFGVAAIAAAAAAMLVRGTFGGGTTTTQAAPPAITVEVLVASKDITPGNPLVPDLVRWEAWPKSALSNTLITKELQPDIAKAVEGVVVRSPLVVGQPITDASVVRAGAAGFLAATIKPGLRAIGVPVTAETSAGGFILPNDRVDVVLTRALTGPNGDKIFRSETILRDVRVLAIDQTAHQEKDKETVVGKTATLELTLQQSELVARSAQAGVLSLALRPLGDSAGEPVAAPEAPQQQQPPRGALIARANPNSGGGVVVLRYGIRRTAQGGGNPSNGGSPAGEPELVPNAVATPTSITTAPAAGGAPQ